MIIRRLEKEDLALVSSWWTERNLPPPDPKALLLPLSLLLCDKKGPEVSLIAFRTEYPGVAIVDSLCTNPKLSRLRAASYLPKIMKEMEKRLKEKGISGYFTLVKDLKKVKSYQRIFQYEAVPEVFTMMTRRL